MDLYYALLGSALVYTVVLAYSAVSGQNCTNNAFLDPLNVDSYGASRLVPLLGRHETFGREQWIFFDLQFTCRGTLIKWMFRGLPDQDIGVEITTWRLNTRSNFFTSYDRVSTTERNAGRPTRNGAVFTYELLSPVEVLPGDIVGAEMGFISFGGTSNNIIALNVSGSGSNALSYRTSGSGPSFILQSVSNVREQDIVPLLQAVVEPVQESTTVMDVSTDSPTIALDLSTDSIITTAIDLTSDSARTRPDRDDMNQSEKNLTVTIVASVCGGIMGILIIVILCICIVCITKHIQVHVHYDGEENSDNKHRENTTNSSDTPLQMNRAYRQAVPTSNIATTIPSNGNSMQCNLAYGGLQNQMHEPGIVELGSPGDYEKMSGYIVFRHGNPSRRQEEALPMEYIMPVQQGPSNTCTGEYYDDVYSYEYIQ